MSDYTVTTDFSAKDSLPANDPEKDILGADFDVEFDAIAVAIATKLDLDDRATQAQAEAGTNNTTWMTPLRVSQAIAGAGAGGAGIVNDLIGLTNPGADRILFWDNSAGEAGFLEVGAGLTLSGTTLTANAAGINHDSLDGFVADEHVDHTSVTLTAGEGLTGGGDISTDRSFALDFAGLTEETTLDLAADLLCFYDDSASAHRKIPIDNLVGTAIGDGRWHRSATQSLSAATEATVVFNAEGEDNLERGTFNTTTGVYTAGSEGTRIFITANVTVTDLAAGNTFRLLIEAPGTTAVARYATRNDADSSAGEYTAQVSAVVSLTDGQTATIRAETSGAATIGAGAALTNVSIVELA